MILVENAVEEVRSHRSFAKRALPVPFSSFLTVILLIPGIFLASPSPGVANNATDPAMDEDFAAKLFHQKCAGCHSGAMIGSDLQNTSAKTTTSLQTAVLRMQMHVGKLKPDEIDGLVELLHDPLFMERLMDAEELAEQDLHATETPEISSTPATENWTLAKTETEPPAPDSRSTITVPTAEANLELTDPGAEFFSKTCAGCHSIGGAKRTGPDLAATVAWPEAELETAVRRMEKYAGPMEDGQVKSLVELLHDAKANDRLAAAEQSAVKKQAAKMEKPSPEQGEQLFHGKMAFANGGVSCASCHGISHDGGTMGPDLTHVYTKLGEMALQSACEQGNFKVMSAAYRDHKVTTQEAIHLTAYLKSVDENPPDSQASAVPLIGTAGAALLLGLIGAIFRKRNGGAIRPRLKRRR